MVAIYIDMPKGCQHCRFFRKHMFGNGLDYSYSCELGATEFVFPWIRQMEQRACDCPLVEIGDIVEKLEKLEKIEQIVEQYQFYKFDGFLKIKEVLERTGKVNGN